MKTYRLLIDGEVREERKVDFSKKYLEDISKNHGVVLIGMGLTTSQDLFGSKKKKEITEYKFATRIVTPDNGSKGYVESGK